MPGRVAKLDVQACEVRGGEYVLYDRSDPAKAQKIWQAAAEQGDATAQFRLGQIYEMGVGGVPDYQSAARWYKQAADKGNNAGAVNLAILYEKGLGVPRDPVAALNLYRKAQGLTEELMAASDIRALRERIVQLEREIQRLKQSGAPTESKASELTEAKAKLLNFLRTANVPVSVVVDVGEAADRKPRIDILDPSLVLAGNEMDVPIREEIQVKQIVGRVKPRSMLSSLTVNDKETNVDRFGVFDTSIPVKPEGTLVHIVAVGRDNEHDELTITLRSAKSAAKSPVQTNLSRKGFGNYVALIIGNNLYRDPDLPELRTPVNDANAVADILKRKYGFTTKLLLNATFDQILNALNDYVKTLTENDNLLIYYAGHGNFDVGKRGYWLPVDAEKDRNTRWILDAQITDLLLKMNARKILVVADSCYSGVVGGANARIQRDIPEEARLAAEQRLAGPRTRTLLTSGFYSPVWDGGAGNNSIFARAFLDVLANNDSILEGARLSDAVEGRVIRASQVIREKEQRLGRGPPKGLEADQEPQYLRNNFAGDEGGDFIFLPLQ